MTAAALVAAHSVDAFLGGRVEAVQPARGHHRSGLEAVLLAASLAPDLAGELVDLGGGAGVAGLCAAARCPGATIAIVERDLDLLDCARAALVRPANQAFADRVRVVALDIGAPERERAAAGLARGRVVAVLTNPPFHEGAAVRPSPAAARAAAHVLGVPLAQWFRVAASALRPDGVLVVIIPVWSLEPALGALSGRFGAARILPIHPRAALPAHRVLLRATKGSRAPLAILPGLVLHGPDGNRFLPPVEALLRGEAGLADIHPSWLVASGVPS